MRLEYGMLLMIPVNPIKYVVGGMGVPTSDTEEVTEFTVEKYWTDDTDPMKYKVKCTPNDTSGRYGTESFYASDLTKLIEQGSIKVVAE